MNNQPRPRPYRTRSHRMTPARYYAELTALYLIAAIVLLICWVVAR